MRCHLCTVWAALLGEAPQALAPVLEDCMTCGGRPEVRSTVRRSIFLKNEALASGLEHIREPLAHPEPTDTCAGPLEAPTDSDIYPKRPYSRTVRSPPEAPTRKSGPNQSRPGPSVKGP